MSEINSSFVIASKRPKELAEFYAKVHKVETLPGISSNHYLVPIANGLNIQIYKPSDSTNFQQKARAACLCFQKGSCSKPLSLIKKWCLELEDLGGRIVEAPKKDFFGAEAWIADPEDNDFLIFVPVLI
tara:strand:+ start:18703 stop:19089 length:387 start_codon:yes stop_codon:yes gene_type:complete